MYIHTQYLHSIYNIYIYTIHTIHPYIHIIYIANLQCLGRTSPEFGQDGGVSRAEFKLALGAVSSAAEDVAQARPATAATP